MTYDFKADWCPRCATRDLESADKLCEQCKLPHYAITPTMFGKREGDEGEQV